jgi:hypothetical protein
MLSVAQATLVAAAAGATQLMCNPHVSRWQQHLLSPAGHADPPSMVLTLVAPFRHLAWEGSKDAIPVLTRSGILQPSLPNHLL